MSYQIDQSGKIEHTNRATVLALSNDHSKTIKITATEKQKVIANLIRTHRPHKTYVYQIFAALTFNLVKSVKPSAVSIDIEYPGHQSSIKEILIQLFDKSRITPPEIHFSLIGKKSRAHILALSTFQSHNKPDITITSTQVLNLLSTKKGWRSRSSRENP